MFGTPKPPQCHTRLVICGAACDDKAPSTPASKIGNSIAKPAHTARATPSQTGGFCCPAKIRQVDISRDSKLGCVTAPSENSWH